MSSLSLARLLLLKGLWAVTLLSLPLSCTEKAQKNPQRSPHATKTEKAGGNVLSNSPGQGPAPKGGAFSQGHIVPLAPKPSSTLIHRASNLGVQRDLADVAEARVPGVVNIATTKASVRFPHGPLGTNPFFRHFGFGPGRLPRGRRARSLGSGVILSRDGLVVTNNHVIDKGERIRVTTSQGREFEASVVGTDPRVNTILS